MIETPSACRSRLFETRAYHDIYLEAVRDGVEWIAAPKPILQDETFQFEDIDGKPSLRNLEPIFDAPNCVRLGKDILFQISNTGNHLGMQWLKNTLEPRGYRIHAAEHIYSFAHMDSTIVPLAPGKVLLNSTRVNPDNCPKVFEKWDKIYFEDVNVNPATALSESVAVSVIVVVAPAVESSIAPVGSIVNEGVALISATLYQPEPFHI